jgi:hypothetical protein
MPDRSRPRVSPMRSLSAMLITSAAVVMSSLLGCASAPPYFLVESHYVDTDPTSSLRDVTEAPDFANVHPQIKIVALQPPDVCADRGQSGHLGPASLELDVLRTRCGVEMAELERALARSGYRVVSWDALHHLAASRDVPILEAASELRADALFQVNALERVDIRPGADARWERRFHLASVDGSRVAPARVPPSRRGEFESIITRHEKGRIPDRRIGATINVSVVSVATGTAIWFYEWTRIEDVGAAPRIEILLDCDDEGCREASTQDSAMTATLFDRSSTSLAESTTSDDQSHAIFHILVRELVTDLAERFAGRR